MLMDIEGVCAVCGATRWVFAVAAAAAANNWRRRFHGRRRILSHRFVDGVARTALGRLGHVRCVRVISFTYDHLSIRVCGNDMIQKGAGRTIVLASSTYVLWLRERRQ